MKLQKHIAICSASVIILTALILAQPNAIDVDDTAAQISQEDVTSYTSTEEPRLDLLMPVETCSVEPSATVPPATEEPIVVIPTYDSLPLSTELQEYTYFWCTEYDIVEHYELVLAMMWHESHYRTDLISKTNDYGIMQINKQNHQWLHEAIGVEDFLNPEDCILAGIHIIAEYLHKYESVHRALMSYNLGEGGARKQWNAGSYSTSYSRCILRHYELVKLNQYDENP